MRLPSYSGGGLVNLVAELEFRLTGQARSARLDPMLADLIPPATTYVLVVFDGLGDHQLDHPVLEDLRAARLGRLEAGFGTTTTTSLATIATGLPPSGHGLLGHLLWLPELARVVNSLKWVDLTGTAVTYPTETLLPSPNLWERLRAAGLEPITVQPASFAGTPLSRALYRGCRFEAVVSTEDAIAATTQLAGARHRLIFSYFPEVDYAAHVHGQGSFEYRRALSAANRCWALLAERLPPGVVLIGTSDHGVLDVAEEGKVGLPRRGGLTYYGDPRAVLVRGNLEKLDEVAAAAGVQVHRDLAEWWGPEPRHPALADRLPEALLLAGPGQVLLPPAFDRRLRGYHGGLSPEEVGIPLLLGGR